MKNNEILYLCGAKGDGAICPVDNHLCYEDCYLTTYPEYAKNGPCEDPKNHPERFAEINGDDITYYEERRSYDKRSNNL